MVMFLVVVIVVGWIVAVVAAVRIALDYLGVWPMDDTGRER